MTVWATRADQVDLRGPNPHDLARSPLIADSRTLRRCGPFRLPGSAQERRRLGSTPPPPAHLPRPASVDDCSGGSVRQRTKILLDESELPTAWYNVVPDLPAPPPPPLHPATRQPVGPADLAPLFPSALIAQEVTGERYVDIPGAVLDVYRLWRPSPLYRAHRLEQSLGTPARIYYKYEGVSPAGSHKPNTAVPQAYYNAQEGVQLSLIHI